MLTNVIMMIKIIHVYTRTRKRAHNLFKIRAKNLDILQGNVSDCLPLDFWHLIKNFSLIDEKLFEGQCTSR